jgi:hypothetical protein
MRTFTVKDEKGQSFDVDQDKLGQAEADGFFPIVTNGKDEQRVASKDFSLAMKDGYKPVMRSDISKTESAIRGAVQGFPFVGSYSDEATGALESAAGSLGLMPDKTYQQARDEARANNEEAAETNPKSYYGGMIGVNVPLDAAKMVPVLGNALGAVEGATYGLGASNADLTKGDYARAAVDTGIGAGVGFAVPKVLSAAGKHLVSPAIEGAGKLFSKISDPIAEKLSGLAGKFAENATGATGLQASRFRPGAGQELLDRGLVKFGDNPEKIAERTAAAMQDAYQSIDQSLKQLDANGVKVSTEHVVGEIEKEIAKLRKDPSKASVVKQLENEIENIAPKTVDEAGEIAGRNFQEVPISEAEATKRGYQDKVNWLTPDNNPANAAVSDVYKNAVENTAEQAAPETAKAFESAKDTYGLLAPIKEAAQRRAATLNQHQVGGLLDLGAGAYGLANADSPGGKAALAIAGRRIFAPRVASAAAVFTSKIAKILQSRPQALGRFAKPLEDAAARGGNSLGVTHYILQSIDPEYQKLMQENKDDTEGAGER